MIDRTILAWAAIWALLHAPREYARLVLLQVRHGVFRIRLAVPLLANEKYHWRKMFDHNPLFVTVTDKAAAKDWVSSLGLPVQQPRTLWCGTDAGAIPDEVWNTPMLIKATHGCQMNVPVTSPPDDRSGLVALANGFLLRDHGARRHQWAYGPVPRQLIAEEWVFPDTDLVEFKCYTFGEMVTQIVVIYRGDPQSASIWSRDRGGTFVRSTQQSAVADIIDERPLTAAADDAIAVASQIGGHFDHIRVDYLSDGKTLMLGELTVYNLAGRAHRQGHKPDTALNRSWDLRKSWFLTQPQKGWRKLYAAALRRALDRRACSGGPVG